MTSAPGPPASTAGRRAGNLCQYLGQLSALGEQFVDFGADAVGGRYSERHGRDSFFADLVDREAEPTPVHPIYTPLRTRLSASPEN